MPSKPQDPKEWCQRCQEREAAPEPHMGLLDPRHEQFARNIAIHRMARGKAYMEAGYATKNITVASAAGSRLMKRIDIQNRVQFLVSTTIETDVKTREWVDDKLKEIVDRCMQGKPHLGRDGKPDGQWMFDAANANKALFSMGKDRGMFVEKVEIGGLEGELRGKSDDEVRVIVETQFAELGRPICMQLMEKVFGLRYQEHGEDVRRSKAPTVEPVPTVQ